MSYGARLYNMKRSGEKHRKRDRLGPKDMGAGLIYKGCGALSDCESHMLEEGERDRETQKKKQRDRDRQRHRERNRS